MEWKHVLVKIIVLTVLNGPMLSEGRTGNVCKSDVECPENAYCKGASYCTCKDGYIYAVTETGRKECLRISHYSEPCEDDIQCQTSMGAQSECFLNTCTCKTNTQLVDDRCYTISRVGELCMTSSNCYFDDTPEDEQAFCVRGFCSCQLNSSPRDKGTRCVPDAQLGEQCVDQEQCAGVGLVCHENYCRCKEGFVAHNETKVCYPLAEKLDDICEYDIQCDHLSGNSGSGAAICLGGDCSCDANAVAVGEPARCWFMRRPGEQCRVDQECYSEDNEPGFCRAGRCTCIDCVPDDRDFSDHSTAVASVPLLAAILATAAIFA